HVIGINDGDTITVLVERQQVKVRLADIDAPESKQPLGSRSKQALSDVCYRKDARLETQGRDRYGRTIATVYCAGSNANATGSGVAAIWNSEVTTISDRVRPEAVIPSSLDPISRGHLNMAQSHCGSVTSPAGTGAYNQSCCVPRNEGG